MADGEKIGRFSNNGSILWDNNSFMTAPKSLLLPFVLLPTFLFAQSALAGSLNAAEERKLAELMCRQLPNVTTILETIQAPTNALGRSAGPTTEPPVTDDVYDALVRLGRSSLPCLANRLTDTRWMPDPRSEPLLGVPLVGDVAYMILADKGVPDMLSKLTHKKPDQLRMDDYFIWPSVGDHRLRLQAAVRAWLSEHPNCCAAPSIVGKPVSKPIFRMSADELELTRTRLSSLRPGLSAEQVLKIAGKPDAIDKGEENQSTSSTSVPQHIGLLGLCSADRAENLAYIFFAERWTGDIFRRDPLRDRYVILFFSAEGKFTRMFSNIADIPPIFPQSETSWHRLMWGEPKIKR
jgi:hypothetical protein